MAMRQRRNCHIATRPATTNVQDVMPQHNLDYRSMDPCYTLFQLSAGRSAGVIGNPCKCPPTSEERSDVATQAAMTAYDENNRRFGQDEAPELRQWIGKALPNKGGILERQGKLDAAIVIHEEITRRFDQAVSINAVRMIEKEYTMRFVELQEEKWKWNGQQCCLF
jgi:hypothetical protein